MERGRVFACTICGEQRSSRQQWYLISEDRWGDKLKILHWDDRLAARQSVHCACSPAHLQELVVHWMTTGSLNHPFARLASQGAGAKPPRRILAAAKDDLASRARQIGEISVHRESMQRVLSESPQSLRTILDALLSALHRDMPRLDPEFKWEASGVSVAPHEV